MTTALDRIVAYKKDEVDALRLKVSESDLLKLGALQPAPRGFATALETIASAGENALICEIKRKSPSAGDILPGADPVEIARDYEQGGAACLSVLTDGPSFGGSAKDLKAIRSAVTLPILRKDFMVDPIQVIEARAMGTDAILVILASTSDPLARDLIATAHDLGMDTLIEVHDPLERDRALTLGGTLIGVNNRDLKAMVTYLAMSEHLAPASRPHDWISESGLKSPDDLRRMRAVGYRRFLIGESLMKETDRPAAVKALRTAC